MAYNIFVDTNVYLDLFLQRGKAWKESEAIFELANQKQITVFTSASNVLNLMYVMRTHGLAKQDIVRYATVVLNDSVLLNPDNRQFKAALASGFPDLEDAVQYFTATGHQDMDYFVTSNTKDFKKASAQLPVLTPPQFMNFYRKARSSQ